MKKIKVALLMGGRSSEHEISLESGKEVVRNLNADKYEVFPILISKDGKKWELETKESILLGRQKSDEKKSGKKEIYADIEKEIDVVFIAMHGAGGEDGKIQGFLDLAGKKYTGSGLLASALAMDKAKAKLIFQSVGLSVPRGIKVKIKDEIKQIPQKLNLPVFVKPNSHGSSVGSSIARSNEQFKKALADAYKYDEEVLVEEYVEGQEFTVSIIGNDKPTALPVVEIVSKNEFFDYESKYDPGLSEEIRPARISSELTKKAQEIGLTAYQAIGCRGFARVDLILKGKIFYVLEVNTIPGLTPVSLFPKAAKAAGFSYSQLLDKLIGYSLDD